MADTIRTDPGSVIDGVLARPWDYDFFGALRRIESSRPDLPRLGTSRALRQDPIRFGQFLSLGFATSALEQPQLARQRGTKLMVRFTGLTGPNGPLPLRYTDFIRNRLRGIQDPDTRGPREEEASASGTSSGRDSTLAEFLDIFHHRTISLFYRAWAVAQKTVDLDRPEDHTFAEWIACLLGICFRARSTQNGNRLRGGVRGLGGERGGGRANGEFHARLGRKVPANLASQ